MDANNVTFPPNGTIGWFRTREGTISFRVKFAGREDGILVHSCRETLAGALDICAFDIANEIREDLARQDRR
jgi:hypothetical protein